MFILKIAKYYKERHADTPLLTGTSISGGANPDNVYQENVPAA